jgi:spermidine synthase
MSSPHNNTNARSNAGFTTAALCAIFFLSGASALIFETLWFRLAGLTFGNSVWASAVVLSSFMAGLALGNGLAVLMGRRIRFPVRLYAYAEITVAVTGIGLVLLFPYLPALLTPLFRYFFNNPWILNPLRLIISFALFMIPATAMGLTLPLMVKGLYGASANYGEVLGKLYGWNTFGAVAGALIPETVLIGAIGITGTGLFAGLLNLLSAMGAMRLVKRGLLADSTVRDRDDLPLKPGDGSFRKARLLIAGFLSGAILLAYEVVWFRFLILQLPSAALVFAVMLAVVLAGIAFGGVAASLWFRFRPDAGQYVPVMAFLSGVLAIVTYSAFNFVPYDLDHGNPLSWLGLTGLIAFPVSFVSGILFTAIGEALHRELGRSLETTGLLTMVNTAGAMIGAASGGFVLLAGLGMEKSFFALALCYGVVGLLVVGRKPETGHRLNLIRIGVSITALVIAGLLFPFGAMEQHITAAPRLFMKGQSGWKLLAIREGLTETSQYWERRRFGKKAYVTLFTNNYSMSSTMAYGQRYMKFFVYLPVAVHPNPKDALLVCYGVGSTAEALTDTKNLESIDVVDISEDILENSSVIFPDDKENPLLDPRVSIYIEDGRFFLQTAPKKYDVITGEPPPPLLAGVVNLYSEEYFRLIYDRLKEGGITTYWLPVRQLGVAGTEAVLKAFSNVFDDCTLWTATPYEWMMVGTRNHSGPVSEEHFVRQWDDPTVAPELRRLGFETPEAMGATFMLDTDSIEEMLADVLPVTDNFPKRINPVDPYFTYAMLLQRFDYTDIRKARSRFSSSPTIQSMWPSSLTAKTGPYFLWQELVNDPYGFETKAGIDFGRLTQFLKATTLKYPAKMSMGGLPFLAAEPTLTEPPEKGAPKEARWNYYMAVKSVANRDYARAADYLAAEQEVSPFPELFQFRPYVLCLADRKDLAAAFIKQYPRVFETPKGQSFSIWLSRMFGMDLTSETSKKLKSSVPE